ncbi:substrate-binding domain-containing protein [Paenibacillus thalictri]|nr:substrate-binding domain-containing protein [Paenibacillus thalictri]
MKKKLNMKKMSGLLFLALLAALTLSACDSDTQTASNSNVDKSGSADGASASTAKSSGAAKNETYYWISQNSTLPLFVANDYPGLDRAAKELNIKVEKAGPTNIDLSAFIATIDQVCAQKPAGVTVVGWDPALTEAVNRCMDQGVPTITDDADLPNSKRFSFVGTDWYDIGVQQAKAMVKATGGKGEIATLSMVNADNMKRAVAGFTDTLKGTELKIVAQEDDGGDSSTAASKTASLLSAYPNLLGIAGFDSESGAGIVRALEEAGKVGKVKVTAMEQTPEFLNTVKEGKVDAIIIQKRELFTYYAIKTLYDFNHNGLSVNGLTGWEANPVPVNINTGLLVVTKDNIGKLLDAMTKRNTK